MSISFNEPDLQPTYNAILSGSSEYDWALFNQTANELKLSATGNGLDDLEEEFLDGRIQYAFARVKDDSSNLDKFVLIAWCGEGVPESRKGLFHTHMDQVSTKFLKGAHLVIQARSDLDVTPSQIMKRLRESGGSKYGLGSTAAPGPRAAAPKAAPSYRPSQGLGGAQGKPSVSAPPKSEPTPAAPPPPREPSPPPAPPAAPAAPAAPPAPSAPSIPTSTRPPVERIASASTPAPSEPPKPAQDDRIAPVGTAYEPVKLAKPGKLANRWNPGGATHDDNDDASSGPVGGSVKDRMAAFSGGGAPPAPVGGSPSGKKLTWSERQAQAKKQAEEEEAASKAASSAAGVGSGPAFGRGASFRGVSGAASTPATEAPPAPPAPPPAPAAPSLPGRTISSAAMPPRPPSPDSDEEKQDDDDWGDAPAPPPAEETFKPEPVEEEGEAPAAPPPPPPPPPAPPAQSKDPQVEELERLKSDLTLEEAPGAGSAPPVPMASRPGGATEAPAPSAAGQRAKAVFDYEAAEEGEIGFADEEIITQIEQVDEGWWSGTNAAGQSGLFPSNYVELIEEDSGAAEAPPAAPPAPPAPEAPPAPPAPPAAAAASRDAEEEEEGEVMIAQYDYDAAEDNEISFKEGDKITSIEKVDADWWQGQNNGKTGLFPAAYVCPPDEYQPS